MNTESAPLIRVLWNGSKWIINCDLPTDRIKANFTLSIPLPAEAIVPLARQQSGDVRELFPAGTILFISLPKSQNHPELDQFASEHIPKGTLQHKKTYWLPVRLEEALRVKNAKSGEKWGTMPCRLTLLPSGLERPSLNQAVETAHKAYTTVINPSVNVFKCFYFICDQRLIPIDDMRTHVVEHSPLPTRSDPGAGTLELPLHMGQLGE